MTMGKTKEQLYLTVREASEYLGVSVATVHTLIRHQDFPVLRVGSLIRIPKKPFLAWIEMQTNISRELRYYMKSGKIE